MISDEYRDLLYTQHTIGNWGHHGKSHAPPVEEWALELGAKTILDFGCGKGTLKEAMPGWSVSEYDPGIKGKEELPEPADLLVCTDVLEHVEPAHLDETIKAMYRHAKMGMFLHIACSLSGTVLADGRNSHLIVQQPDWWIGKFHKVVKTDRKKGLRVWIKT